ncbi:uncharacterized protein LOC141594856 [Silene latifolia]|uniref:uncharacterized protein LOC141594856 n=1 Tax=Silene latifolia TaxID=37657 RepID=UPI003D76D6DE
MPYLSAADQLIGCMLSQENEQGFEQVVFYLSRVLQETEQRYTYLEKVCLSLYDASVKLRHYFMAHTIEIVSTMDVMKHMLSQPLLKGRLSRWSIHLLQFDLVYIPQRAMKGQVLADFLIEHPIFDIETSDNKNNTPCEMYFDGSFTSNGSCVGVVITSPKGREWKLTVTLHGHGTNNKVEYEALIIGLEKLIELGALHVRILGESQLVINQVNGLFKCKSLPLSQYLQRVEGLLKHFRRIE